MDLELSRYNMITQQARAWGVLNNDILALLQKVPREQFVPEMFKEFAFADVPLPLGHGQTMWTPKEEARVLQAIKIKPTDTVLEIGTGSGYMTALLSRQAKLVHSIDIFPEFIMQAQLRLNRLGIDNVILHCDDGSRGWSAEAPYDVIVITASLEALPAEIQQQLAVAGRLFAVIGKSPVMTAQLFTHTSEHEWNITSLFETVVPSMYHSHSNSNFNF